MTDQLPPQVRAFLDALEKLPPSPALTFAGVAEDDTATPSALASGVVTTYGVTATSLDPRVATENFATRHVLAILGRTGRDLAPLSQYPDEREVVFRPVTLLRRVAETRSADGAVRITLVEELVPTEPRTGPPLDPATVLADAAARVDAALAGERVAVHAPGKFLQPLPVAR